MPEERLGFNAEVGRLLDLVASSLYSEREIFLRELISNASDACDRLRYLAVTNPTLMGDDSELRITVGLEPHSRTLWVADNGVGMSRDELISNLGTIARSGTASFVDQLPDEAGAAEKLIGQFGVGFYSVFMVADRVDVLSRRADEEQGWRWSSDGKGEFTVAEEEKAPGRGTLVRAHLRADQRAFMEPDRVREVVRRHSDHIGVPILFQGAEGAPEQVNTASALWARAPREIDEGQYRDFYQHVGHAFDDPWLTVHFKSEGRIEYTCLVFVPTVPPFDLVHAESQHRVKLYVRRVHVSDDNEELVPRYLRFLSGVVDSEDLPLNVSRETLQENPIVGRIRQRLTRQVLRALKDKAEKAPDEYEHFWEGFGAVLKEGLALDTERRDELLELCRFRSTATEGFRTLAEYVAQMPEGQEAIYYLAGEKLQRLRQSPQLEAARARGVEVLLLTDQVDEFWLPVVGTYAESPFGSVSRGVLDLDKVGAVEGKDGTGGSESNSAPPQIERLIERLEGELGDSVRAVRSSSRLTDSPACLVADEQGPDLHLSRLLRQHGHAGEPPPPVLEINPTHPLIQRLAAEDEASEMLRDAAHLLLDQARLLEGEDIPDPSAFSRRLVSALERGLG